MTLRTCFVLLAACGLGAVGCEQQARIPYIPPTLADWPKPYRGVDGLTVHVFDTGTVRVHEALILRNGSLTRVRDLPVLAFVIVHPTQGLVLFNTGLNSKRSGASAAPGGWLNFLFTSEVSVGQSLAAQMRKTGFKPEAVRWIVVSNLRSEHTGGLEDFPNARVVVAKNEHDYALERPRGYALGEFDDIASWKFIDFTAAKPVATFRAHVDLFGDGSCLLLDGGGATPGTMALLLRLPHHPLLLADDMAPLPESVRYAAKPTSAYDMSAWWDHVWRLKRFKDLVPDLIVVPGYDLTAAAAARSPEIVVHPTSAPAAAPPTATPGALQRLIPHPM